MTEAILSLLVITLTITGLNSPIKKQGNGTIDETWFDFILSTRVTLDPNMNRLKVKRW